VEVEDRSYGGTRGIRNRAGGKKGFGRMSKKAFDKIASGLNEALEIARGNPKPAKLYVPAEISVRDIRKKLCLSCCRFDGHPVKLIPPFVRTEQG